MKMAEQVRLITIGVDASRSKSGGALAHLVGIIGCTPTPPEGVLCVHLWAPDLLLQRLPDLPWLVKHLCFPPETPMLKQLAWQRNILPSELRASGCDIAFNTDAGTVNSFRPAVTLSQDLLAFEPGERQRFGLTRARARQEMLRRLAVRSLRRSEGAIFLSQHAQKTVSQVTGPLRNVRIVAHGVNEAFRYSGPRRALSEPIRCVYVSEAAVHKHNWNVVRAIRLLREEGMNVSLELAGGGRGRPLERLTRQIEQDDPRHEFVQRLGVVPNDRIPQLLRDADVFIFASSCESLPVTLLEALASAIPIASSNRGPMPETAQDAAVYFDPEKPAEIAAAIRTISGTPGLAARLSNRGRERASEYVWGRCAEETWAHLVHVAGLPR